MTIADVNKTTFSFIAETTPGATPATPVFTKTRSTGGQGIKFNQQFVTSNEIRADRNIADRVRVSRNTSVDYDFELSYGTFDAFLEGLLQNTWLTNVLENGITPKYFTIEEIYELGATDEYKRAAGVAVNTMSLAVQANSIVTGSVGMIGFGTPTVAQAIITGATYTDVNDNPILSASTNFASFAVTGLTSPKVQSLNLSINNNLREQPVAGSIDGVGIGSGQFDVTGDMTLYFENSDALDIFLADTATDLAFSLGGASDLKYDFSLPRIKVLDESMPKTNTADLPITLQFGATYDSADGHTLEITRTPAA